MEFERAITLAGGYGSYQKVLFLLLLPMGLTFVFGVSSMSYVMPAAICEFKISKYHQGLIYSAIYFGMVPSGALWGIVADSIGRKPTLIITCGIAGLFEFLCAFSLDYWFMFVCKFLSGCTVAGVHLTYYIYLSEFTDPIHKDAITMLSGCVAACGYFIQPLIASFLIPKRFKIVVIHDWIYLNSWKIFLILSSLAPISGFLISLLVIGETPKFLLLQNKKEEALNILKEIYAKNTGKAADTLPVKEVTLKEISEGNDSKTGQSMTFLENIGKHILPLFRYPYLVPALMSFAAQAITMGAFNAVRPYIPTLFSLALGIGQFPNSTISTPETTQFCVLFKNQEVFRKHIKCDQDEIVLDPRIFYGSTIVGLCVFISFFFGKYVVQRFGKELVFVSAHSISAVCIALFPYSTAYFALLIVSIFSVCMQNCLTIAIGLMINRTPTILRGITISIIMVCGRVGVIIGNQVLPLITNISCKAGFWTIAFINLLALPTIFVYSRQPNPLEDRAMESAQGKADVTTIQPNAK